MTGQEAPDDERERIISDARAVVEYMALHVDAQEDARKITLALDLLARKHPEPEITEEMVERASSAFGGVVSPDWSLASDWERIEVSTSMRAALEAALQVPVGEGEQRAQGQTFVGEGFD